MQLKGSWNLRSIREQFEFLRYELLINTEAIQTPKFLYFDGLLLGFGRIHKGEKNPRI